MVYRIDPNDVVVHVDGAFRRFADAAGVPELPENALGHELWSFIADEELRALYHALVARARTGRVVHLETRCDSPSLARSVELDITLCPNRDVEIACKLGGARLLSPALPSGSELLRLCAWCYRAERGGTWRGIEQVVADERLLEQPVVPLVTHGICDACLSDAAAELETVA
jgi:hypothetical protein